MPKQVNIVSKEPNNENAVSEKRNRCLLSGTVCDDPKYSHTVKGNQVFLFYLMVQRKSGVYDRIPCHVQEPLLEEHMRKGEHIFLEGQFRSTNLYSETDRKTHLIVYFHVIGSVCDPVQSQDLNEIYLDGTICKPVVGRMTPSGKKIADVILAVNRADWKSDYIPCICWNGLAAEVATMNVGDHLICKGRIQSRNYEKALKDGTYEQKTAYEVSIFTLKHKKNGGIIYA